MNDTEERKRPPAWHLVIAATLSIIVLIGFYIAGVQHFKAGEWNEFGDFMAGAAGVILTALTFLALLYTVHIQSTELSLSRQELKLTREEMSQNREELSRSAEALNAQVGALYAQNFERSLFDSLRFLNDVVAHFEHQGPYQDRPQTGPQAFYGIHRQMLMNTDLDQMITDDGDQLGKNDSLNKFLDKMRPLLGTYFRTLYNIYRYLDESSYSHRVYYNRIIRSQIPDHALAILFYNSLTVRGRKFQRYVIKYNILDNLPPEYLLNSSHAKILETLPTPAAVIDGVASAAAAPK